jgi:hypothetical protein
VIDAPQHSGVPIRRKLAAAMAIERRGLLEIGTSALARTVDVRFWHLADIEAASENVRSWG